MLTLASFSSLVSKDAWTKVAPDQAEYNRLSMECSNIVERFTAMGAALSSPIIATTIFQYLKSIGTPISLRVLKDQIAAGRVPARYLNNV